MTKVCGNCKKPKEFDQFYLRRGQPQFQCKVCANAYWRKYYAINKARHQKRNRKNHQIRKAEIDAVLLSYLRSHPCVDCSEDDIVVLHFDHVKGKSANISAMRCSMYSVEAIMAEVARCEVRCANCHMRKTARDFGWSKFDSLRANNLVIVPV